MTLGLAPRSTPTPADRATLAGQTSPYTPHRDILMQQPLEERIASLETAAERHEQTIARLVSIAENRDQLLDRLLSNLEATAQLLGTGHPRRGHHPSPLAPLGPALRLAGRRAEWRLSRTRPHNR